MRRNTGRLLALFAGACFLANAASAGDSTAGLVITSGSPRVAVFSSPSQSCEKEDVPDIGTRAFRDSTGIIHLVSSDYINRAMVGSSFETLHHDCHVIYKSAGSGDPAAFSDREWLGSFYTADGKTIYALVHSEFEARDRATLCPQHAATCWAVNITFAKSLDGGYNFLSPPPAQKLVAASPRRYTPDQKRYIGYTNPTNIVEMSGYFYAIIWAIEVSDGDHEGACLIRTSNPADPKSWRGWDGTDFQVQFADPYRDRIDDKKKHLCAQIGRGALMNNGGLVKHEGDDLFVVTEHIPERSGAEAGIYYTTSSNLRDWSRPNLLISDRQLHQEDGANFGYIWPSLIDPHSRDRNFATVGDRAELFYIASDLKHRPYTRTLYRRPVQIATPR